MINFRDSGKECVRNLEEEELVNDNHLRQMVDSILKEKSLDSAMVANDELNSNQDNLSTETITEISESSLSLSRIELFNQELYTTVKGHIRASHEKSIGLIRAEEIRAAHLRVCSFCNKNFSTCPVLPDAIFLCVLFVGECCIVQMNQMIVYACQSFLLVFSHLPHEEAAYYHVICRNHLKLRSLRPCSARCNGTSTHELPSIEDYSAIDYCSNQ